MTSEVRQLIEAFAATLGTTAEHLWGVLLRQAILYGWFRVVLIILNVAAICLIPAAFRWATQLIKQGWDEIVFGASIIFSIFVLIVTFVNVFTLDEVIAAFANPEYLVLMWVLEALK